ncbi:lactadherin-like [Strongylocentrotus purpuratus]|uniref:F5/8 type C domain-containing protein n=1 Tax=Strongylocentrotus purpuratus TaxID=7668 RepID=A0A7M7P3D3_STRPU|nr:lactadherin-like [Strongylocentrotus purpuratus]
MSSLDNHSEAVNVRCPANVTNITNCWYEETAAKNRTEASVAVVCCTLNLCSTPRGSPVGLESGKVPDSAITVSSEQGPYFSKQKARLNSPSAWIPKDEDEDPWLQIKFNSTFVITAIMTQGWEFSRHWVTSYTVSSSMDGAYWTYYQDINTNTVKVYTGNYDHNSYVVHTMSTPVECRFFPAMNQEEVTCSRPIRGEGMGVEDGRIPDSSLTSSSRYNNPYTASDGRLNGGMTSDIKAAWVARNDDKDKWVKVYAANYNEYTPETILFPRPITARYVRIHPLTWHWHQAMRYEVLGITG